MQSNNIKLKPISNAQVWAKECNRGIKDAKALVAKFTNRKQKAPHIDYETSLSEAIRGTIRDASPGFQVGFFYGLSEHLLGGGA